MQCILVNWCLWKKFLSMDPQSIQRWIVDYIYTSQWKCVFRTCYGSNPACVLYPPLLLCTVDVNKQEMLLKQIKILMQQFHRWDWIVCYLVTFVVCLCLFKKSYNHILLWHCYQNTWTHKVHFQFHKNHQSRHTTETDERSTFHSCLLRNALMVFLFCLLQTFYKCFLILGKKSFPTSES